MPQKQRRRRRANFGRDGLTTVEYLIVACLIAVVAIALWQRLSEDEVDDKAGEATTEASE